MIARVAQLADHGDLEEYAGLFTENGSWEYPGGPRRGRADILAGARERRSQRVTGPGSATRHIITTLAVRVEDAAAATADSCWLFWRDTATSPVLHNRALPRRAVPRGRRLADRAPGDHPGLTGLGPPRSVIYNLYV